MEPGDDSHTDDRRLQTTCLLVLAGTAIAIGLYLLRSVLIPFVLAVFLVQAMSPLIDVQVKRLRFPKVLALVMTLAVTVLALAVAAGFVSTSVGQLGKNATEYQTRFNQMADDVITFLHLDDRLPEAKAPPGIPAGADSVEGERTVEGGSPEATEGEGLLRSQPPDFDFRGAFKLSGGVVQNLFLATAKEVLGVLSNGLVVLVFVIFLLLGQGASTSIPGGLADEIQSRTRGYIVTKVWLSAFTGILVSGSLWVLRVDLALVFGLFAFLLNFIPSIGSVIATLLPIPVILLQPGLTPLAQVLAVSIPAAGQFAIGNIVEPKLMGRSLELHPVVVLLALIFWGTIWGIIGMFLATPLTAVTRIVLERLPATRPAAALLAGNLAPLEAALSGTSPPMTEEGAETDRGS